VKHSIKLLHVQFESPKYTRQSAFLERDRVSKDRCEYAMWMTDYRVLFALSQKMVAVPQENGYEFVTRYLGCTSQ